MSEAIEQESESNVGVLELPALDKEVKREAKVKKQPRYNVILLNDDDHTFGYVIQMLRSIFGKTQTEAKKHAFEVHQAGRTILLTTTLEHGELKQEQIHSWGPDPLVASCAGSMSAVLEPL